MAKMNIPNRLTIIRILLVPVVVAVYLCMDPTACVIDKTSGLALRDVIAFVIFAVASITDLYSRNSWHNPCTIWIGTTRCISFYFVCPGFHYGYVRWQNCPEV